MKSLSHVRLLATPWTAAYQALPSMGFSRQEYWSGVPLPSLMIISRSSHVAANGIISLFFLWLSSIPLQRRQWHPTPVLLPGKSHGWRSLVGCSPWGHYESDTTNDFTFTFHFHALEKEMATHSSVLAWRIPGTWEPRGLRSMESHRVGHD